jgi:hypothetical protein
MASGSATIMGAHAGLAASLAAGTSTTGEQAARGRAAKAPISAVLAARAVREAWGRCILQAYRRSRPGQDTMADVPAANVRRSAVA